MATSTKRTIRTATSTITALLILALVAGFASVPGAAAAAESATRFDSSLTAATRTTTKIASSEAASLSTTVTARRKNSTTVRAATSPTRVVRVAAAPSGSELSKAQAILAGYIAKYPALAGASVSFGDARGYQAICYYKSGRIVISSTHTASLERIIGHEIWHILDWRDNGQIDWGENVPPK